MKLPRLPQLNLPEPKLWDLTALAVLALGIVLALANIASARAQSAVGSISGSLTTVFLLAQMAIAIGSLMLLGKTAKKGTIWGNLMAVAGLIAGISGVLLAGTLWVAA